MKLNIGDQVIIVGDPRAGGPHIGSNHKIGDKGIVIEIDEEHHFGAWPYFIEVKNKKIGVYNLCNLKKYIPIKCPKYLKQ